MSYDPDNWFDRPSDHWLAPSTYEMSRRRRLRRRRLWDWHWGRIALWLWVLALIAVVVSGMVRGW